MTSSVVHVGRARFLPCIDDRLSFVLQVVLGVMALCVDMAVVADVIVKKRP